MTRLLTATNPYSILMTVGVTTDLLYLGLTLPAANLINLDNDTASIVVTPTSGLLTSEAGGTASFMVVLTSMPTAHVVIPVSVNDATEGSLSITSLTFTPANWNIAQTVVVTGVDDALVDGKPGL